MLRRIFASAVLIWLLGFVWFAMTLPAPAGDAKTDAVVVLTGGEGRIARGIEVLRKRWAGQMLVSGVDREVRPREFVAQHKVPARLMACCVKLGFESVDTRSNAQEAQDWIERNRFTSVRLVTSDWHMRRAALEIGRQLTGDVRLVRDGVPSRPSLRILFLEYNKWLARFIPGLLD